MGRQMFSHLQGSRAPSHTMAAGEDKPITLNYPTAFFFPQLYALSMKPYGLEYPFGQMGPAVLAVPPPSSLCTPSPLAGGVV